jgi:bifunctional ADP-heptose synthase (sugar kinase/adenylyltransferase)
MLTLPIIEQLLARFPDLRVGVLGDLFLDRYLDLDARLTEPSLETGLPAYQVVRVRAQPGAAGTVMNNLAALGVGRIVPLALIGDDGEGYELRQALAALPAVDTRLVRSWPERRTPTYTKPMLMEPGQPARELNRLDIKNRTPTPPQAQAWLTQTLTEIWPQVDAWIVLDQVSEVDCGVVTASVMARLAELAAAEPTKFVLADSRERIDQFRNVCLKPNRREAGDLDRLRQNATRDIYLTDGPAGIRLYRPGAAEPLTVPAYPVSGPIDPVGAGDSTSAGITLARAAQASPEVAAAFGNLIASITIQQLGTTGTATPTQVRERWRELAPSL